MEIIGIQWRELISVLFQIPFNLGHLTLAGFAYFLTDWRSLQFALSIPSVILISYFWLIPESPRWLYTVGRIDDTVTVLTKAAKVNKLPTENIREELVAHKNKSAESDSKCKGNIMDLVRTPNMRKKSLAIFFNWFVCGLAFFGVAQYIGQLSGDIYANVAISAALELPGTIVCIYSMKTLGRKKTLMFSNILTGVSMLAIAVVPKESTNITVILASLGIIGMSSSFPTAYLYAGELFPTVVRNIGVGTSSMVARLGSMLAPFVAGLSTQSHYLPPLIFGIIPIVGAAMVLFLPETKGVQLPETLEDGELFGKKEQKSMENGK